jgi:hypothetical protein
LRWLLDGSLFKNSRDFADFVDAAASRIARAHARGERVGGARAKDILASLTGPGALSAELDTFAHGYAQQVRRDHAALKGAIAKDPLLARFTSR